jgi:Peroxidase, family 2
MSLRRNEGGHVTPEGEAGAGGKEPDYVAPKEGDSRCCSPALNAMANHSEFL